MKKTLLLLLTLFALTPSISYPRSIKTTNTNKIVLWSSVALAAVSLAYAHSLMDMEDEYVSLESYASRTRKLGAALAVGALSCIVAGVCGIREINTFVDSI